MKRAWVAAAAFALVGVGFAADVLLFRRPAPPAAKPGERRILYYRDPMNPQATSATPRKAPDGMDYVPVHEDEAGVGVGRSPTFTEREIAASSPSDPAPARTRARR